MLLIHAFYIYQSRIRGAISETWQPCMVVTVANAPYASGCHTRSCCRHGIPDLYIVAQHNTKSNTRVAFWQKESDDLAQSALQHAADCQIPMPKALDDTMFCLHNGILVAHIVVH